MTESEKPLTKTRHFHFEKNPGLVEDLPDGTSAVPSDIGTTSTRDFISQKLVEYSDPQNCTNPEALKTNRRFAHNSDY